ncbi:MAG: chitobiase/beta-hexosaminidase C-terminal domain-containing protein [bacterium]|nr:chitobiase/beta-hexosaminidase C-terminal domain-containing protein [bacterium]
MKRYLCLALLALAAASAVASEIALDLRPRAVRTRGVAAPRATQTEEEAGTLRQTVLDAGAASTGSLAVGDVLRLSVYDDVTLSLTLVAREEAPLARASFQAEVSGANWRDAVVTETDAGLLVTATDPASGLVYAVVSSDDRVTVREIDPHALPVVDGGVRVPELDAVRDGVPTKRSAASTDQASTVVDMLVAYDRPAAAWAKANGGGVTNLAQQCVARMNGALANNGLDAAFRFRLVGVMAVDADGDGNLNDTLDKVTQKTGAWAAVSAMRDAVGADVVSTMVDTGSAYGTTGLGWSLTQTTASDMRNFSEYAYNVLSVRAAAQSHVMAHETGHNMGAGHADAQTSSPGPQSFIYSRGFYFTGTDKRAYHTVMAYNNDGYGNSYDPAPLFSDPDNAWAGVPAGDATHDNAQVLARTYAVVAQFRAQKVALSYDVFFSPEGGALFSDSVTVTLTPGKAGLAIRYTTDGSDPTATHGSLYTSPLTLTKTTTIRAATVTDGTAGPVYAATYYKSDLGAALNAPQLVWNTSADYPWTAQATNTYDGTLAVQSAALPKGTVNRTWLSTTVTGPTKMSFRYRAMMYRSSFRVFLDSSVAWQTADAVDDWTLVEVDVPTGVHAVKFEYEQRGYYSDPTFCGVWLDDVRWIPEGSEGVTRMDGNGNEILIPASWFERHGLAPAGATAADLAAAADADSDGDGMGNWTEYVCGTDPNNADDRLRCTISFVDGSPVVGYEPRDGYLSGYRAVLKGKASLSDAPWTDATPQHRFFKVVVEKK